MMTCKDCIHYDVCAKKGRHFAKTYGKGHHAETYVDDVEFKCDHFKDESRFIELPCKVGDVVYVIQNRTVIPSEIIRLKYEQEAENHGRFIRQRIYAVVGNVEREFDFSDFGRIVFRTNEEAEEALKDISQNDK